VYFVSNKWLFPVLCRLYIHCVFDSNIFNFFCSVLTQ
jgi:hypothetical protein